MRHRRNKLDLILTIELFVSQLLIPYLPPISILIRNKLTYTRSQHTVSEVCRISRTCVQFLKLSIYYKYHGLSNYLKRIHVRQYWNIRTVVSNVDYYYCLSLQVVDWIKSVFSAIITRNNIKTTKRMSWNWMCHTIGMDFGSTDGRGRQGAEALWGRWGRLGRHNVATGEKRGTKPLVFKM